MIPVLEDYLQLLLFGFGYNKKRNSINNSTRCSRFLYTENVTILALYSVYNKVIIGNICQVTRSADIRLLLHILGLCPDAGVQGLHDVRPHHSHCSEAFR